MNPREHKESIIFRELKKNKKAQKAFVRLGRTDDWKVAKLFLAELRQTLLESSIEVDQINDLKKYKHLMLAYQRVALLPELVRIMDELEKEDEEIKRQTEQEQKRRKFNPGAYIREKLKK